MPALCKAKDNKEKNVPTVKALLKDARQAIKNKRDQARNEQSLEEATKRSGINAEQCAEIRHVQALLNISLNDAENLKAYLKQKYDTASYFNTMLKTSQYALMSDSLDNIPDEKGKIRCSWRNKNREILLKYRANVYNGGRFYLRKNDFAKALPFFETFLTLRDADITKDIPTIKNDTLYSLSSFYAMVSAYNTQKPHIALKYINEAIENADSANRSIMQEYKVRCLAAVGDTLTWISELEKGCNNYPQHNYFFTSLLDYYENERMYDKGISLADSLLQNVQDIPLYYYAKSLMYQHKEQWDECIAMSDSTLNRDPQNVDALFNKGISYVNKAMEYAETACYDTSKSKARKDREHIQSLYRKALPPFEEMRRLLPEASDRWANPLYRIYLNLNMGKEFEEIEKIIGKM